LVADIARRVDANRESKFAAEGFEVVDVAFGVMAEAEVFSLVEFDDVEAALEDFGGKVAGGHPGEVFGEGKDDDGVEAGGGKEIEFFGERGDEGEGGFGAKDVGGVWFEGNRYRWDAKFAGACDDLFDDPLMAAMHAIEVADGGYGGAVGFWNVCELAKDLHQAISNVICWPS